MPTVRRKPPSSTRLLVANMTPNYLYLGIKAHGVQGIWLAPKGQPGYVTALRGVDFYDKRVVDTLKSLGNSLKLYIALNEGLAAALGISTTTWAPASTPTPLP